MSCLHRPNLPANPQDWSRPLWAGPSAEGGYPVWAGVTGAGVTGAGVTGAGGNGCPGAAAQDVAGDLVGDGGVELPTSERGFDGSSVLSRGGQPGGQAGRSSSIALDVGE